ncbi:MAG TPA: ankyrin repeat domain-containing protein [Pyrinomonadaceae bacterium]
MSAPVSLTNAVTSGDERAVAALLASGADVNERTSGGQTALILAVIFGHTNLVQLLINAGADAQLRDNLGLNAIEWAKRRGSREALEILTNKREPAAAARKVVVDIPEPEPEPEIAAPEEPPPAVAEAETKETVSEAEKSRRWLAGLRQRLDEQELRRKSQPEPEAPPSVPVSTKEPVTTEREPVETPPLEPTKPSAPVTPKIQPVPGRIFQPPAETSIPTGKRKRCPRCNAIYNGDLVSYCAHHIVKLVDADEPIISDPPRANPPLFWIMVIITLTGSIVVGSLITTYLYKSNQAAARTAATQQANIQKGSPELSEELAGKAVSLPDAECPLNGPDPLTGTVVVRVMVDKKGQVYWARGSGGDWLMRGASTEAAMKSTFSPEKLRGRETEGTITYTFK